MSIDRARPAKRRVAMIARPTRVVGLLVVGATAVAAAGCGGGKAPAYGGGGASPATVTAQGSAPAPTPPRARAVSAAATRTLARSAKVAFRLDGASALGSARGEVFGSGAFDFASGRGSEVIDLPEIGHQEPGNEHAIFFPAQVYLQPKGKSTAVLPHGKLWMTAPVAGSESISTNFPNFIEQVEGVNPTLLLQELAWGATSAVPIAERPAIKGVRAQGYKVSVDLTRALAAAGRTNAAASGLAIQQQLTALAAGSSAGGGRLAMFAWVDPTGRIAQIRATVPGSGLGTSLLALGHFGLPVSVSRPAPARVIDINALTPSGERESSGGGDSDGA